MIVDCISDLHGEQPDLDGGDILIVAGDLTASHSKEEFWKFARWIAAQDYEYRVVIGGNHDSWLQEGEPVDLLEWRANRDFIYLCDSGTEIEGLKVWGSPWTLEFPGMNPNCRAFVKQNEDELQERWDLIPHDTDILITHSPPNGKLDKVSHNYCASHGSETLRKRVCGRGGIFPKLHVFGHIHEHGGKTIEYGSPRGPYASTKFVNASYLDEDYLAREQAGVRIIL